MSKATRLVHERHPDWEWFDRADIIIEPRWKTSGLSGDEWRFSAAVRLSFKGLSYVERSFQSVEDAAAFLPGMLRMGSEGIPDFKLYLAREEACCDNVGCASAWTVRYRMKKLWSSNCFFSKDPDPTDAHYRQFCSEHKKRGDCGLDDTDSNYELLESRE